MVSSLRAWQWSFLGVFSTLVLTEIVSYLRFKRKLQLARHTPRNEDNQGVCTVYLISNSANVSRDKSLLSKVLEEFIPQCQVQAQSSSSSSMEEEEEEINAILEARDLAQQALELAKTRGSGLLLGVGMYTSSKAVPGLTQFWVVVNQNGREYFASSVSSSAIESSLADEAAMAVIKRAWAQI